jgi:excisionase family DNA binding protein
MPYVRVAGRYRVSREDVAAVVNARRKRGAYRRQPAGSVTIPEAAIRLGVHPRTVWRWIRQGSLPAQRVRERSFVMPEDLQRWEKEFGIDGANLIGTKEAGLILGVCQRTVYSMVVRGDLKASRRGSRIRLERSEVTKAVDRPSSPTPERLCGRR